MEEEEGRRRAGMEGGQVQRIGGLGAKERRNMGRVREGIIEEEE